jgi:ABC-type multidrug transport system fused ATPase/permease subunit
MISKKIDDFEHGSRYISYSIYELINKSFYLIFSIISLYKAEAKLAYFEIIFINIYFILMYFLSKRLMNFQKISNISRQKLISVTQNSFMNIFLIKIIGNFNFFFNKNIKNYIYDSFKSEKKYMQFNAFGIELFNFLFTIIAASFQIYFLSYLLKNNFISTGSFAFLFILIFSIKTNLSALVYVINYNLVKGFASINATKEIFFDQFSLKKNDLISGSKKLNGDIVFKNVCFSYPNSNKLSLSNINLDIKSGSRIGIIGKSGSSKSTLLKILIRCFDVESGEILIDGNNIKNYNLEFLWSQFSIIPQETNILYNSIYENLLIANNSASKEEIENICKKVDLHDDIMTMKNGYNTILNENSSNISGGQRQRLGIARALLRDSNIIILDEATSSLDSKTEKQILNLFNQIFKDKKTTVIFVTHKISNLENFDTIISMKNGEIEEIGNFQYFNNKENIK